MYVRGSTLCIICVDLSENYNTCVEQINSYYNEYVVNELKFAVIGTKMDKQVC